MALRSVVLAPPPGEGGPRRTVVLRPGGPKDKGKAVDLATLVIGALLLLATVVLLNVLPNKEYALPQFSVTFPENQTENPSQSFPFTEAEAGRVSEFTYDLPGNVHSITLVMFFQDDLPGSLPDQFRVELFDPAGNPIGARFDLFNAAPRFNDSATPPGYEAGQLINRRVSIPVGLHPEDQIVQGLSHLEVVEQVRARLEPQYRLDTAGTWTVRVTLVNAADCPNDATAPDADRQQILLCPLTAPSPGDGTDEGNPFTIENFIYTTYRVKVEELS